MDPQLASLWNFYHEHAAQARQHEDQREHMTNILLAIAGAIITFLSTKQDPDLYSFLAAISLIPLGLFGWAFSYKHYEKNRLHTTIMDKIRAAIDNELLQRPNFEGLAALRQEGETDHYANFPTPQRQRVRSPIAGRRLHSFWSAMPLLVTALGILFALPLGYDLFVA